VLVTELQLVTIFVGQGVQRRSGWPHDVLLVASYDVPLQISAVRTPLFMNVPTPGGMTAKTCGMCTCAAASTRNTVS
jgi:hypothetical protein